MTSIDYWNNIPKKELSIILSQLNASFIKTSYNILIWDLFFFYLIDIWKMNNTTKLRAELKLQKCSFIGKARDQTNLWIEHILYFSI